MARLITLLVLSLSTLFAYAQSGDGYDWRSGNSYTTSKNIDGSTNIDGFNTRTGARWNTTIESDGDMQGTDSEGNIWQQDGSTGTYINYGTSTICVGEGYGRICN